MFKNWHMSPMCVLLVLVYLQVNCVKINTKIKLYFCKKVSSEIALSSQIALNVSPGTRNERQG